MMFMSPIANSGDLLYGMNTPATAIVSVFQANKFRPDKVVIIGSNSMAK